jgi:hypothetical protein
VIVEFGRAWTVVNDHRSGVLERAAIVELSRDAGGAEVLIAYRRGNAAVPCRAQHTPGVGLAYRAIGEKAGTLEAMRKKRTLAIAGEAGVLNIILKSTLKREGQDGTRPHQPCRPSYLRPGFLRTRDGHRTAPPAPFATKN